MTSKKQIFSILVCTVIIFFACITAYADETQKNVWHGDSINATITKGKNEYTFQSVYLSRAYEMSNHMVSLDGGQSNDIPQLLILVDAENAYEWKADGMYSLGNSNYEVLYCCDAETGYNNNVHYRRLNLEDSNYYSDGAAGHIRAITSSSYPYITIEEMKTKLKSEGFTDADALTRAEIITAVQMAIWSFSNDSTSFRYSQTFDVSSNPQWGTVFHDYTNEMQPIWWNTGKRVFSKDSTVAERINSLADHLKSLAPESAPDEQKIITEVRINGFDVIGKYENGYLLDVSLSLNNTVTDADEIYIDISVDDLHVASQRISAGSDGCSIQIYANEGQTINASVSGAQSLPAGVYFYEPEGGRHVSQCLVGVSMGKGGVHAKASMSVELPELPPETGDNTVTLLFIGLTSLLCAVIVISKMKHHIVYITETDK
jgi:hypothetical protein